MYSTITVTTGPMSCLPRAIETPFSARSSEAMPMEELVPQSVIVSAAMPVTHTNFIPQASAFIPTAVPLDIAYHFGNIPDPRHSAFRDYHLLGDILVIALSAMLSG